ncbi:uncharacterized protein Eint_091370 [Encephalitozoon intestinalis ATCC 50506]|uniref:G domain-containing protein n=1 Tax=Encephalitozoon intestinalis (strain ATCC 50506) TaxID=876142 RepID=E0S900_ENCIT|nr:uncharacterized protein Eint_091370 [Encephalitozoon intestinalis ATCC 50506]ADM12265.1 hypothetical protein Eint_091370 [Encephalitozoon intestinalis ATCC 50506]UTX46072.1 hypothetical protein GPK93_09g16590 [Encephalitozoon intestinalis]
MIFLLIFTVVLAIFIRIVAHLITRRGPRVIKFVGPRGAGKTKTLNALMGIHGRTVPTLESYKVIYKGMEIHDVIPKDGSFFERYGIDDPSATYFFFLRSMDDSYGIPGAKGLNVRLVYCQPYDGKEALERGVLVLDKDLTHIEKYFS